MINKEIVIINQSSGYLMVDIANAFVRNGYKVYFIAGNLVEGYYKIDKSVEIFYITKYNRSSILKRLYSWFKGFFEVFFWVKSKFMNKELLIVTNPPFLLLLPLFCVNPYNLLVFDVYIETLQKYLLLKRFSPLVFVWKSLHRLALNKAKSITVLTEDMRNVVKKYTSNNVNILPLWGDFFEPVLDSHNDNEFVLKYGLQDKFVILYTGNFGFESGIESIFEVINMLKNDNRFMFVFVGSGHMKNWIDDYQKKLDLKNCIILPFQQSDFFPYILSCAHISIVSISMSSSVMSIPSKTFNYLSAGSPILCIANENSVIFKFVEETKVGKSFCHTKLTEISSFLNEIFDDNFALKQFKECAQKTGKKYTLDNANLLVSIVKNNISNV